MLESKTGPGFARHYVDKHSFQGIPLSVKNGGFLVEMTNQSESRCGTSSESPPGPAVSDGASSIRELTGQFYAVLRADLSVPHIFPLNCGIDLLSMDRDISRGLNPEAYLITPNIDHRNDNIVPDDDRLIPLSRKYEHRCPSMK
jgi:hypothetical protein